MAKFIFQHGWFHCFDVFYKNKISPSWFVRFTVKWRQLNTEIASNEIAQKRAFFTFLGFDNFFPLIT